jgi:23S rRNA pseudouridine2605 synthase
MRINQFLASATGVSRRNADELVAAGRVEVDGLVAELGQTIYRGSEVLLDGKPVTPAGTHHYVVLNKPEGYVCSRRRQGKAPTIYELLPGNFQNLRLTGRLDADSSGLLLLTDDGPFIQQMSHPSNGKNKLYQITLSRPFISRDGERMAAGIELTDGLSVIKIQESKKEVVTVSMEDGRNRQLRRTFGALGYRIKRLHRIKIGPYDIGDLEPGAWKEIEVPKQ